jgi:hypothetical protein
MVLRNKDPVKWQVIPSLCLIFSGNSLVGAVSVVTPSRSPELKWYLLTQTLQTHQDQPNLFNGCLMCEEAMMSYKFLYKGQHLFSINR